MTTANRKSFFCQMCGKLTDARTGKCGRCGGNPVIQSGCSVSESEPWFEKQSGRGAGSRPMSEYEALRDQLDYILRENRALGNSVSSLERELIVTKAGLETLLGELNRGKLLKKSDFIQKWAVQAKVDFKGIQLKELYLRKKWEFLGKAPAKNSAKFESLLAEAERLFSALEWEKAYGSLGSAEASAQGNFPLTAFMARFALEMEKFGDARRFAEKSLKEKPLPLESLKLAALSYMFSGSAGKAQAYADRWLKEAGESYEPLLIKAFIKFASGKWDEAAKCSEKAIRSEEGLIPHLILAFSLIKQEKRGTARKVLEKASRFYPASPEIKHMQHALFLLCGSVKEAVTVRAMLPEEEDRSLCRKREKLLSVNKIESFFDTVKPDMEMVLSDLHAGRLTSA